MHSIHFNVMLGTIPRATRIQHSNDKHHTGSCGSRQHTSQGDGSNKKNTMKGLVTAIIPGRNVSC